jgi:flagellin FlaB
MMKNIYSEDAFTGLEAAIVLIAFVVVAAVFSYVVLGAGFFTTQTAQATVHTGVAQASSSLEVVGNVMGISNEGDQLSYANISVALTAGGTAMDLDQMVVSYTDNNGGRNPNVNATPGLGCAALTLGLDEDVAAAVNTKITFNMQPSVGAVLPITRTLPGGLNKVQGIY